MQRIALDGRAAGETQTQKFGRLVKGFAHRIVNRGAEATIFANALDNQQLAVAARDKQQQVGKGQAMGQPYREGVPFQVIDTDERQAARRRNAFGRHQTDNDAANQARPRCDGNTIKLAPVDIGLFQGVFYQPVEVLDMGASGDFGHNTTKSAMRLDLGKNGIGQDFAACLALARCGMRAHNGGGGFVAACFNAQYDKGLAHFFLFCGCCRLWGQSGYKTSTLPHRHAPDQGIQLQRPQMQRRYRIGTRGSRLALIQAHDVAARVAAVLGQPVDEVCEIEVIKTTGDMVQDRNLSELGGKGLFTKEIEEALSEGRIDFAVHSMKDMPTQFPDGLVIDCLLERVDPRDAFLSSRVSSFAALPQGAVIGTSSLRRAAQVKARRPDLQVVSFRGNVDTRIKKLADGVADATLLAMAGLTRMGLAHLATAPLSVDEMLPAVAQGAVGVERRRDDDAAGALLAKLHHAETGLRVAAERALLAVLDGSCRTPIAALAVIEGERLSLRGMILTPDGAAVIETSREGLARDAVAIGEDAGREIKGRAGPQFFTGV